MPTYTYECHRCAKQQTLLLTLAEHDAFRPKHCRKAMFQVMFAPQIVSDVQPYRSMITGERIAGRKQHRDHLRAHGCIEIGNEAPKPRTRQAVPKTSRREALHKQLADVSDKQADKMLKQLKKDLHV